MNERIERIKEQIATLMAELDRLLLIPICVADLTPTRCALSDNADTRPGWPDDTNGSATVGEWTRS